MSHSPNRILEFLTARPKPDGEASRSNRRRASSSVVDLSWLENGRWESTRAKLLDISRGGAGMTSRQAPPVGGLARLRFVEGEGSPWVEVKILGVEPEGSQEHRVRIRFEGHCPSVILRLAVLGPESQEDPSETEPRYSWAKTNRD
jgi:hypothetical protein